MHAHNTYRLCQFQHISPISDGTTVTSVAHKCAREKHGTQVITIQHIHGQCGGGCSALTWIGGSVLDTEKELLFIHGHYCTHLI